MPSLCLPLLAILAVAPSVAAAPPSAFRADARLRWSTLVPTTREVSMFVQTDDVAATTARIEALGGKVGTVAGDVLTVIVPSSAVGSLAESVGVHRLEAAAPVHAR